MASRLHRPRAMLGSVVGNYRVTSALSSGGMGTVYRAEHLLIGKPVAIKVLLPAWSTNRDIVGRFFNEARITTTIKHPGIVDVIDFGYHDGRAYLVMELLDGESLATRLATVGRIGESAAIALARSIAGALAAAHAAGVVHRDLKPDNVFLVRDPDVPGGERPKLLDFGIAKLADGQLGSRVTRTGMVVGTPLYMAPEQCRGSGSVDARADLYSLGCILYELVAGRPPFVAEGSGELLAMHQMTEPDDVRIHAVQLGARTAAITMRLLAKLPEARFASATELLAAFGGELVDDRRPVAGSQALATPVPTTLSGAAGARTSGIVRRRSGVVAGALGLAAVVVVGVIAIDRGVDPQRGRPAIPAAPTIATADAMAPVSTVDAIAPAVATGDAAPDAASAVAIPEIDAGVEPTRPPRRNTAVPPAPAKRSRPRPVASPDGGEAIPALPPELE